MATSATTSTTNLDVNSIVTQLMTVERQPITKLALKEASYQAKLSAYGSVKGAVSTFQSALSSLNKPNTFQTLAASSSDSTVLSASTSSIAVTGSYSMEVSSLAQSQKLAAAGQASSTDAIGSGNPTVLTFDFGTISGGTFDSVSGQYTGSSFTSNGSGVKTVTINSNNNSLQGIRDAINGAGIGVTASIINDGSGAPYRLVLSSDSMGADHSVKISTDGGDAAIDTLMTHNPAGTQGFSETVTASNANFKVNGVAISKASNTVGDVIGGVTLNLNKVTTSPVTLNVSKSTDGVATAINGFVKAYNDLSGTLAGLSAYDAANKKAAILQGDATVRSLQTQLRSMLGTAVTGVPGNLTTLGTIGVSFQKDGTLAVDQAKLNTALTNNFTEIGSLFASVGQSSDSMVTVNNTTPDTKPGNYAVNITQLATRGNTVGSAAITVPLTVTAASNDTLDLVVDGSSAQITLSAGTYNTIAALATELQSQINGATAFSSKGISVVVSENAGVLTLTSANYGSTTGVSITGGTAETALGLVNDVSTNGVDVAGTIGGLAATGSGQLLSGTGGDISGLGIRITGGATGDRGVISYSKGYATTLNTWSSAILASDGVLAARTNGIDQSIADIGKRKLQLEDRLLMIEQRYRAQYTALDTMLSSMNTTSSYLSQQLAALQKTN